MAEQHAETERRFIAHVVKDDTGARLEQTRKLPADVFDDFECARAWRILRWEEDYNEAAKHADVLPFFGVDTAELQWIEDLREIKIAYIRQYGSLARAAEVFPEVGPTALKEREAALWAEVQSLRFDVSVEIPEPEPRFQIAGKPICTPGNISDIVAEAGVGKSAFLGAFIGAVGVAERSTENCDTLGVTAAPPEGRVVVHIDTEQSRFDHKACIVRALRRARYQGQPDWLHSYPLAGYSAGDLRQILRALIANTTAPIHSVILDGGADFLVSINDETESNEFVAELHALAIKIDAPIVSVVHGNPGNDTGKARGHFGSQLERKAESVLHLKKSSEITTVKSKKSRRAPILDSDGVAFTWSEQEMMHVSCAEKLKAKEKARKEEKKAELLSLMLQAFGGDPSLRPGDLKKRIMEVTGASKGTAENRITDAKLFELLAGGGHTENCYLIAESLSTTTTLMKGDQ